MQMFKARVDVAPEDRVNTVLDLMNLVFPNLPNPIILHSAAPETASSFRNLCFLQGFIL